ncbi:WW domain binding protein 4 [Mortierella polycephala]|uniref:WW domain binding protein 4 n=1 Tax=Mortierella polycephala TaxID=41804 RepID=A0A9P6Q925_9FUNG|nr:WW domain binding protein 4 [Mortierella polycephala]
MRNLLRASSLHLDMPNDTDGTPDNGGTDIPMLDILNPSTISEAQPTEETIICHDEQDPAANLKQLGITEHELNIKECDTFVEALMNASVEDNSIFPNAMNVRRWSEYWKSNAKFFCRFCKIYITDNKSTRNIHDSGVKHKENVERFLREQNQRSRDKETETARTNKQMEAIEKAALKQYQLDVEAGLVQPSTSFPAVASPATVAAESVSSKSESSPTILGSKKPTASTGSNSVPVAEPKAPAAKPADKTIGQPGEWQTVESTGQKHGQDKKSDGKKDEERSHYVPGADEDDGEADPEDLRGFKIVEKAYPIDDELVGNNDADGGEGSAGAAVFKKRKAGANKSRNIRRKQ